MTELKVIQFSADEDFEHYLDYLTQGGSGNCCGYVATTFLFVQFPKMKILFSLKADSYDQLPYIEIESSATPEEIRNSVIEDFLDKASHPH